MTWRRPWNTRATFGWRGMCGGERRKSVRIPRRLQPRQAKDHERPKSLQAGSEREARLARINDWQVAPLSGFVEAIRQRVSNGCAIPYFDPLDGGVTARCLYLLEAPGPQAVASGFV